MTGWLILAILNMAMVILAVWYESWWTLAGSALMAIVATHKTIRKMHQS